MCNVNTVLIVFILAKHSIRISNIIKKTVAMVNGMTTKLFQFKIHPISIVIKDE